MTKSESSINDAQKRLTELRQDIDDIDTQLVDLIAKRAQLTADVGTTKRTLKQPLYVPQREQQMIEARRQYAQQQGISPDLIEDVLRRVIRESYRTQRSQPTATSSDLQRPIVIVGGAGRLGQRLQQLFIETGYQVAVIDKGDHFSSSLAARAQLVMISVPVSQTQTVIEQLPSLADDCVLADVTSIKQQPLAAMLAKHAGPVLGLHPMFGPSVQNLAKQLVVMTPGRQPDASEWVVNQFLNWGAHIEVIAAERHDQAMGWIQAMRHLSTFSYGLHMAQEQADIADLLQLSSPIYRMELMMVGRLFAQNAELYADIIAANQQQFAVVRRYLSRFAEVLEQLERGDKQGFIEQFEQVKAYFGDYAQQFLEESEALVQLADDQRFR